MLKAMKGNDNLMTKIFSKGLLLTAILIGGVLFGGMAMGGCGSSLSSSTRSVYCFPDWTPDGKILCVKAKVSTSTGAGSNPSVDSSAEYFITIMDINGSNEADLRRINSYGVAVMSPLGNYIAYSEGSKIKVIKANGDDLHTIGLNDGFEVIGLDWGSDESSIIYYAGKSPNFEQAVVGIDGAGKAIISTNGGSIAWRYGDRIVMQKPISTEVNRVVAIDRRTLNEISSYPNVVGGNFNVNRTSTNEVVFFGEKIEKFDLTAPSMPPVVIINRSDIYDIKLSPDGQKIVGDNVNKIGIYLINIDGTGFEQLR